MSEFGEKVDRHCPYDEATLRIYNPDRDYDICPCCHTIFESESLTTTPADGR